MTCQMACRVKQYLSICRLLEKQTYDILPELPSAPVRQGVVSEPTTVQPMVHQKGLVLFRSIPKRFGNERTPLTKIKSSIVRKI
jgi:hypothetical protein